MLLERMSFEDVGRSTLPQLLDQRAEETPDAKAVHAVAGSISFAQWRDRAAALSELLAQALGPLAGERMLLWMSNDDALAYVCAFQALVASGAMVVSMDERSTALDASAVIDECEPRALIISRRASVSLGEAGLERLGLAESAPTQVATHLLVAPLSDGAGGGGVLTWDSESESQAALPRAARPDDDALIAYTSGSTGRPKGALLTHAAICMYGERVARSTYAEPRRGAVLRPGEVLQSPIPLHTTASIIENLSPTVFSGCALVYEGRRFDPTASVKRMTEVGTTVYNGAPPHFAMICDLPGEVASGDPELLISGGSAFTEGLYRRMRERWPGAAIANWYGLNESGTGQTLNHGADIERAPSAIGRPLWPTEVKIVDEEGSSIPAGTEGELWMRAPGQMREYFRSPEETRKRFHDSWLMTGDRAIRDAHGLIHIVGRGEDRINRGGFKFYPTEVEGALEMHPGVREAAVLAVPDRVLGQDSVAFVVLAQGESADELQLRAHCKERIAANKVPSRILFTDQLPRGAYGKVVRRELIAQYESLAAPCGRDADQPANKEMEE